MKEGFVGCLRNPYLNSKIFRLKASNIQCPEVIDAGVSDSFPNLQEIYDLKKGDSLKLIL